MSRISAVLAALLFIAPAFALAAGPPHFDGGQEEVVAILNAPDFQASVNINIPAGFRAANATMNVEGMAAEGNASAYPENLIMTVDGTPIWKFQKIGFGPFGMQDRFSSDGRNVSLQTGSGKSWIRLPSDAIVQSASMELKCSLPTAKTELVSFTGAAAGDGLGRDVSEAGDVNGDGFDDVVVGAFGAGSGGIHQGQAYIYYGGSNMDNNPDVILTGEADGDQFGLLISGGGDVNGDGYDDVIVSAITHNNGGGKSGRAYLYYGGPNMDNGADVIFSGEISGDQFGWQVSCDGDYNGDGYDDVVVGDRLSQGGHTGRITIYYGAQHMDNVADVVLNGGAYSENANANAGDVDNDGYDDLIVGQPHSNYACIYFGSNYMDNITDVNLSINYSSCSFGWGVSGAGDVNIDGFDDVLVSCYDVSAIYTGPTFLFYGGSNMDNISDLNFTGEVAGDMFGHHMSNAGDLNQDGYGDIIIGAYANDAGGTDAGRAYVYFGDQNMDNVSDAIFTGAAAGDWFGDFLSGAGDVNNDSYDEVIVSANNNNEGGNGAGKAYVYTLAPPLPGVLDPSISVGSQKVWNETGYYNRTETIGDFSSALKDYINTATVSGTDEFGNHYIDIPVNVGANSEGIISLYNLNITYQSVATIPNFANAINNYVVANHKNMDASGNIQVPINVSSKSAGRVKFSGLVISKDKPPVQVQEIKNVELYEDTANPMLIDLYPYFQDDIDPVTKLNFSVVSSTNSSFVAVGPRGNRYLGANALDGDNWTGTVEVVVACCDTWGQKVESNKFMIIVKNVNDAPLITSTPILSAEAGVPYSYNVTAVDGDKDKLQFKLSKAPANMTVDAETGRIQWMPRARGYHNVTVSVSDGIASAEQTFVINVPNKAPRITSTPSYNASVGSKYYYKVTAEDDNFDVLTFSLSTNVIGMEINPTNGTITWTPQYYNDYNITIIVSDGIAKAKQEFTIKVAQGNRAPRFISNPLKMATVKVPYEYPAKAVDDDGDSLSFSLVDSPSGMQIDKVSGKVSWTPSVSGNFTVKIKVEDGKGGEAIQEFTIIVAGKERPKVEITWPPENENVMGKVTITGTATKGAIEVISVEVRLDGGNWSNALGDYKWQYKIDTTEIENGLHTVEVRAFDGKDYSDVAACNFTVYNNKKEESKRGIIPGFTGIIIALVAVSVALLHLTKRHRNGGGAG
jgi:hypothetical protein